MPDLPLRKINIISDKIIIDSSSSDDDDENTHYRLELRVQNQLYVKTPLGIREIPMPPEGVNISEYVNEYLREEHERYHREHGESAKSARANNTEHEQNNLNMNINNNPNEQKLDNKPEGGSTKSCPNHSDEQSTTKTGVESID